MNQHDNIIIVGSGPSANNYFYHSGFKTISVNSSIYLPTLLADYWITSDLSKKNKSILIKQPQASCKYYYAYNKKLKIKNTTFLRRIKFYKLRSSIISQKINKLKLDILQTHIKLQENENFITGGNSSFGALNLAFHMKPKNIILIGIDATQARKVVENTKPRSLKHLPKLFACSVSQLDEFNINVVNASMTSRINCFPKMPFREAIDYCLSKNP
jgi:hypothetical protein